MTEKRRQYIGIACLVLGLLFIGLGLLREDEEVAAAAMKSMENRGITILKNTQIKGIGQENGKASLSLSVEGKELVIDADAVLAATGRRPNLEGLHPEAAGVSLTPRGAVMVDEHLKTTAASGRDRKRTRLNSRHP